MALRAQRLKNFKIALRDWNFQARSIFSSEPPTKALFFGGGILHCKSRLKFSNEIEIFNRDWKTQARLKFFNLWALRWWGTLKKNLSRPDRSRRLWLFPGSVRAFSRKTPGKSREKCWTIFSRIAKCYKSSDFGHRERQTCRKPWVHTAGTFRGLSEVCLEFPLSIESSTQRHRIWRLAHQNRTIAIASDFRVDGAKSPEIPQKKRVLGSEIAARNRKSLATFHRTLQSQCSIAFSSLGNRCDFWGPRCASQSQIAKIAAISVR